jgi:predicted dehydrogenase
MALAHGVGDPAIPAMSATSPRRRLALIGVSGYGRIHLQLAREWRDRGLADIVAAVVINPEEEGEVVAELAARGTRIHADWEEMLRSHAGAVDLCLIPTGIHLHARMTVAALRAGMNVLVEKPLAGSLAETDAIRAAERASGCFVAVGFQDCYDPATARLLRALADGRIGRVRAVRFLGIWPRPRAYFTRNGWAGRLAFGGVPVLDSPLNNACGHFVLLGLLFGGAAEGEGPMRLDSADLLRAHAIESFDTAVVRLTAPGGARLWFGASHACHGRHEPEILVEGDAGRVVWRYEQDIVWTDAAGREERWPLQAQAEVRRAMMDAVMRRLADPAVPVCTTALAARHTALVEAVHRVGSIETAVAVEWSPESDGSLAVPAITGLEAALHRAFLSGERLALVTAAVPRAV